MSVLQTQRAKGHIERVCKKKEASADKSKEQRGKPVRYIDEDHDEVQGLFNIGTGSPEPSIVVPVSINGTDILRHANYHNYVYGIDHVIT